MRAIGRLALGTLYVLLAVSVASCGNGGGSAGSGTPSISGLSFSPTSVPKSAGGSATVTGSIQFTDSGGDIASLNLTVLDSSGRQIAATSNPIQGAAGGTSGQIQGVFQVSTSTAGIFTFNVWIVDSAGARSNTLSATFQVVPVSSEAAVLASTGAAPASLTVANGRLYWTETGDAVLKTVGSAGGTPAALAYKVHNPAAMAFTGTDVIWVDDAGPSPPPPPGTQNSSTPVRALKRTAASGVTTVLDSASICDSSTAADVVVSGDTAYWIACTTGPNDHAIRATQLSGGGSADIYTTAQPISSLAGGSGLLVWLNGSLDASTSLSVYSLALGATTTLSSVPWMDNVFALDATNVYYATANNPPFRLSGTLDVCTLWAQPLAGGPPTQLTASLLRPIRLVAAGGQLVSVDATGVRSIASGGGPIVPLAAVSNTPIDLLVDGADVLWTESTGAAHGQTGLIQRVPLAGGTATIVYQGGDAPLRLALDSSARVTWTEGGPIGLVEGFGRIARLNASNAVETVVAGLASDSPPLIATGSDLFVADQWRIKRIPAGGGMPVTVAADDAAISALTTDGSSIYWTSGMVASVRMAPVTGGPVGVLVGVSSAGVGSAIRVTPTGKVLWATLSAIEMIPQAQANSTPVELWNQGMTVSDLAVDSTNAYFAVPATSDLFALPLAGGNAHSLAQASTAGASPLFRLVLDGSQLYWIDAEKIAKVAVAGGTPAGVIDFDAAGADPTSTLAIDTTSIYWTEPQARRIRSAAK